MLAREAGRELQGISLVCHSRHGHPLRQTPASDLRHGAALVLGMSVRPDDAGCMTARDGFPSSAAYSRRQKSAFCCSRGSRELA